MQQIPEQMDAERFRRDFNVSRETMERLNLYVQLLKKWQKAVNLVAPSTLEEVWHRHIGDSGQIVDILNESDSCKKSGIWLDIGSGGGFPGLVAAIMLGDKFDYHFHLVESNGRKCAFLSDVVRHLDLPVEIHHQRIEALAGHTELEQVSIVSARALASLDLLMELSLPFVGPQTVCYYFKGREAQQEIEVAGKRWSFACRQYASKTSSDGRILEITRQRPKYTGREVLE